MSLPRISLVWAAAGVAWGLVGAVRAAPPSVADALALQPRQKNVDYDRPAADAVARCGIGQEKVDGVTALVVRGPGGEILRSFADTNGNRVVDRWSFYKDGLEVYRDVDSDHDTKADQCRWLNSAGSRWGADADADGVIEAWRQLSAEEATAEVVEALRAKDAAAFARLLPTKADLEAAGFEGDRLAALVARVGRAVQQFPQVAARQKAVGPTSRWTSMLAPQPPGVLPAGAAGVARDVMAFDNVVALVETGTGTAATAGQIFVGSLVRCGEAWRPVDVPQVLGDGDAVGGEIVGFFTPPAATAAQVGGGPAQDERIKPLIAKLQDIEGKMGAAAAADRQALAAQQVGVLEQVVASCAEGDRGFWNRQLIETLAAYVQEGMLPDGLAKLEKLAGTAGDDDRLAAFIAFRLAQARYSAEMQQPGVDGEKLQDRWFDDLRAFVEAHPQAPEAAEAMLQLGFRDEFEAREREAIDRYSAIARDFPDTPQARKATGAVRRLESVGKPYTLAGPGLDGRKFSVDSLRGVPVIVHYWSTDCEPCKVDIAQIREVFTRFGPKKLAVVGVALDGDKEKLAKFLKAKPIPWPQLHEPGGLDSRLAEEFGVLALPTMLLVDEKGNVVDRNVSITELERKLEALLGQ
jgi:thiol-disulfide isomerase/thioredoxin